MNKHVKYIIAELKQLADEKKAAWWIRYLRNEIEFIGVSIPDSRKIILSFQKENQLTIPELINVSDNLMTKEIAEYKIAAVLIYQNLILGQIPNSQIVENLNTFFERKLIFDWNTCDWWCVRVLTSIVDNGSQENVEQIISWYEKEYFWQARAALVPFAQCKQLKNYSSDLVEPMNNIIKRPERFAKTSVGWLLREISKFDLNYIEDFLFENKKFLTKEVINNALKYADKSKREQYYV